tara:strand:- start:1116 stop:2393 length:1278 start_codon:yes stop_codon:yes gene_type:complete
MEKKFLQNYFFLLFLIIPISIIIGPAISLINILLIDLSFIIFIFYTKKFDIFNHLVVRTLIILYVYLIFNSFIALDFSLSASRNFGFFRFIVLFVSVNYFFYYFSKFDKILFFWFIIISIAVFDMYFEYYHGTNILGFGGIDVIYGNRIVSFFKDEPIMGGYIFGFFFIILGYLFKFYYHDENKVRKVLILLFSVLVITSIILTGERSNTLKAIFALILFYIFNKNFSIKQKIFSFLIFSFIVFSSVIYVVNIDPSKKQSYFQNRYGSQFLSHFSSEEKREKFFKENIYMNIYRSGINVFKNYPVLGVGNKNYRVESCKLEVKNNVYYLCQTHPHNIYIEFLAEHGLFGTILFLSILFFLFFRILKIIIISRDFIQIGCFSYLITNFIPILPGGAFFGDFNSTIFWINFSLMYACNKKTNIFQSY